MLLTAPGSTRWPPPSFLAASPYDQVVYAEVGDLARLARLADAGYRHAARRQAELLAERGKVETLTLGADAGNQHAAWRLADVLAKRREVDTLTRRADAGDKHAAWWLAVLPTGWPRQAGTGDEDARWQALAELPPHASALISRAFGSRPASALNVLVFPAPPAASSTKLERSTSSSVTRRRRRHPDRMDWPRPVLAGNPSRPTGPLRRAAGSSRPTARSGAKPMPRSGPGPRRRRRAGVGEHDLVTRSPASVGIHATSIGSAPSSTPNDRC